MGGTSAEKVTQCHNTLTCYIMTSACHSASVLLTCQQKHQKQHTVLPVPSCFKWICITASLHEIWVNYTVIIHEPEIRLLRDSSYRCQPSFQWGCRFGINYTHIIARNALWRLQRCTTTSTSSIPGFWVSKRAIARDNSGQEWWSCSWSLKRYWYRITRWFCINAIHI